MAFRRKQSGYRRPFRILGMRPLTLVIVGGLVYLLKTPLMSLWNTISSKFSGSSSTASSTTSSTL